VDFVLTQPTRPIRRGLKGSLGGSGCQISTRQFYSSIASSPMDHSAINVAESRDRLAHRMKNPAPFELLHIETFVQRNQLGVGYPWLALDGQHVVLDEDLNGVPHASGHVGV